MDLARLLCCPRCRGALVDYRCERCGVRYPVEAGIPRFTDGALERDPRLREEWEAQRVARPLYLDERSVANLWEDLVLPRLYHRLGQVSGPVLDLGCGVGHFGRALTRRGLGAELVGLDFQLDLLEHATEGYAGLVEGDVHQLPFRDGSIAAVVSSNTLHHVAEPEVVAAEIARVLAPGGRVVAWDPRELAPLELVKRVVRRNDEAYAEGHRAYSMAEYRALLEGAGLVVEDLKALDPLGPLVGNGLDLLRLGRFFDGARLARGLAAFDRAVERLDPSGQLGLMIVAVATRP